MIEVQQTFRKITVEVPEDVLQDAQAVTGNGLTQTVREGLQTLADKRAYQRLLSLRGSCPDIELDVNSLREDRVFE